MAVVYFDIVDYDSVIARAKEFRLNFSDVLQGKLMAYDTDGDGDFDVEDAKVLLGKEELRMIHEKMEAKRIARFALAEIRAFIAQEEEPREEAWEVKMKTLKDAQEGLKEERRRMEKEVKERMEKEEKERREKEEKEKKERMEKEEKERKERREKDEKEWKERMEKEEKERKERREKEEKERKERMEKEEKERKERMEKEEKERKERMEKEVKDRMERMEKEEKERMEKERVAREKAEKERLERERIAKEKERIAKEKAEKERLEQERIAKEKERIEKERLERERIAKEKERIERERLAKEKAEKERLERERIAKERERLAKEKAEKERLERERLTREKAEKERLERERIAKERERLAKEKAEKEQLERERLAREKAEKERLERERIAKERERLAKEKAEKERLERERLAREKAEKERLERERIAKERERLAKEKAEKERLDRERLAKEKAEKEQLEFHLICSTSYVVFVLLCLFVASVCSVNVVFVLNLLCFGFFLCVFQGKVDEALRAFESLVQQYPQSPRARYGKAQAEDDVAEKLRSNDMLQRAINTYREAAELPDATSDLLMAALKRRAERQQFLGRMRGSLVTLERLVQIFPEDISLKNDLGVAHLLLGDNKGAKKVYEQVLAAAPNNGFAKVHYGFILKSENKIAESIPYLKEGLESGEPGTDDGRFYFHLGDALQRVGDNSAYHWYELGHQRGHFASVWQRSLYNVEGLKAQPWWTPKETGYTDLVKMLERNWKTIRDEALAVMDRNTGQFIPEEENLREKGEWGQYTLWQQGKKVGNSCQGVPKTCSLLEKHPEATGCKRGQIKFSVMHPGTHVWPHTGPTNCRLRMHLGLVIPKQGCRIRCTTETR
uniref:Aspartyl/asparaginyl beta-hydroxylase-like n=1 Tax=Sphaeramia orbicularis TaxID=375764 RepID=A0A673AY25_9TELE